MVNIMSGIPVVMTIAGSDSGGGAGIEADIKTFAALGVHGSCAITSVTAQNTTGVLSAYDLPPHVISAQINAVCSGCQMGKDRHALFCRDSWFSGKRGTFS